VQEKYRCERTTARYEWETGDPIDVAWIAVTHFEENAQAERARLETEAVKIIEAVATLYMAEWFGAMQFFSRPELDMISSWACLCRGNL